ncbi:MULTISPECIES: hypothetical protein [unclassified Mesorhizobium]|uniref:hypothetical protein n=1 Tax=unclassified Mesorhizobium TaxID=325217 RepID=UPI000FCBB177|nr:MULTISPECIES: hypothetical protein [unclassified Mesorhizobium]RUU56227.1 hypothetical protein EOC99_26900 [Mesorhizobium sp. M7A.T.Ca.TU.009.01.1.1]RUU80498.1 hypothetical protein EOD03_18440 [Mesorhizobium sp. M7A.T.Ca.TU.009.01.1.2]RUT86974.1 hypothetical protein EOD14_11790 [Mesorhizobium sp. M7A.T.Ca.US.000.02.1.1]RUT92201.1 hypothetical protein EOD15_11575 [Mesorhizobium sp. M7A.T.Ca.US.000.02.2.1]RUT99766.1 hypothetical protein EOD12_20975 [Mesorhizobium sp. M7A.T.Ca.TU.009.02.1.1]
MNPSLLRLILALMLAPFLWTAAGAQAISFPELGSALPGRTDVTYLDLARMVIPDLAADKHGFYRGGLPIEMRHIEGPDSGGSPPETSGFSNAAVLAIKAGGKDRLTMLFDLGDSPDSAEGYAVLALYDITAKPKLLDAVNVALDRGTYFREPGKLSVGANDDVLITMSAHFNSSQNYVITPLIMIRDDKFEPIDMIYTFDENLCAYSRKQDVAFQGIADGQPYAAIKVTVTDSTVLNGESCDDTPPRPESHEISVTYHWDKKTSRYTKDSDALDKLAGENANRF